MTMERRFKAYGLNINNIKIIKEYKLFGVTEILVNGNIWVVETLELNKLFKEMK